MFNKLKLTQKILLLVAALSALALLSTLYSLSNLYSVDKNYRSLLDYKIQNTLLIDDAQINLSDASRIIFSVLTEQEEKQMRASQKSLRIQQGMFVSKLKKINDLSIKQQIDLADITAQQAIVFDLIDQVVEQAVRWRGDRALVIIHQKLEPAFNELRSSMDELRDAILSDYHSSAKQLTDTTQNTITNTIVAVGLTLSLAMILAAVLSYTGISRPITRLTAVMGRLTDHQYNDPIDYQERQDEVGKMAQALHIFRNTMKLADRLEIEAITNQKNQRLSEQLVSLTDAMPGAVFQLRINADQSSQFLFLSNKAENFLGQPIELLLQRTYQINEAMFPAEKDFQWIIRKNFIQSRKTRQPIDTDIRIERNGKTLWYKILASCRSLPADADLFNGVLLDVTADKQQAQALEEAKNNAEQAARAKAIFLTSMSHEIRTPLNAMLGLTQLSLKQELHPEQRQRMNNISKAGQHLLSIINDILDFSKIEANQLHLEHITFTPTQLIADTVEMLSDAAHNKNLSIKVEICNTVPSQLSGDPTRIGQVLLNYLHNAIKFSDSGTVSIRAHLITAPFARPQLYCEVEDHGIGIDAQNLEHIFNAFQQADISITRRFGGTGLGLSISRKLTELMGGQTGVRSTEGHGSTFWFTAAVSLDTQAPALENKSSTQSNTPHSQFNQQRVLLVDDNELNRLVGEEMLTQANLRVELACNGQEAVELVSNANEGYYSAVLMDIMMPVLDGISAATHIKQLAQGKNLPIIAVSATHANHHQEKLQHTNFAAYLSKPILEHELWLALAQQLCAVPTSIVESTPAADLADLQRPEEQLAQLHASMGYVRFVSLLHRLIADYQTRYTSILTLELHSAEVRQHLHDLISTAGQAGFYQLSRLAAQLNEALDTQDQALIAQLQQRITLDLQDTMDYLQSYIEDISNI
ncbi:MAG: ATP-binding protein [Pseudomonas sp.]|jgi:signal transduction histidine kinase/DNA-binding NarL/FixJ family response regulator/HAMP domain-containing protein|nr:ATP-binding protein [Pseudomonas sp.]